MSTRSIIVIKGPKKYSDSGEVIRIYKHSDGYPTGNLPILEAALGSCLNELKEHNERFAGMGRNQALLAEFVAARVLGAAASVYGNGASIDAYEDDPAVYEGPLTPEHLGNQGDLEWIYIVDLEQMSVNLYGGGYTGKGPAVAFAKGFADPLAYADNLRDECQSPERDETKQLIERITALGFKVNKLKDKCVKAKPKNQKGASVRS